MSERQRIFLNPSNTGLMGKIKSIAKHVHVICDTSIAPFTVNLPDLRLAEDIEIIFYNVPLNGSGNNVTVTAELINYTDLSHVIPPYPSASYSANYVSDMKKTWLQAY